MVCCLYNMNSFIAFRKQLFKIKGHAELTVLSKSWWTLRASPVRFAYYFACRLNALRSVTELRALTKKQYTVLFFSQTLSGSSPD